MTVASLIVAVLRDPAVREALREAIGSPGADAPRARPSAVYTTAPGGPLPAGRSRRWLRDHAPEIPGATRSGGKRGRSVRWDVPAEAYERWEAECVVVPSAAPSSPDATTADVVQIDRWIASAGYRATKGKR